MSEGIGAYLDPLKSLIASSKFVPYSKPVSGLYASLAFEGQVVASAYAKFSVIVPLLKFFYNPTMFNTFQVALYMHCAQNDEYDLFDPHTQYAELLISSFVYQGDVMDLM